jgi:GNAT superfamily N-acetyltransferase
MHLVLSRVQPEDFDALIPLQFQAFDDVDLNNVFFGPTGPAGYAYAKRTVMHAYMHDAADVWMKVTDEDVDVEVPVLDDETGEPTGEKRKQKRIVAGSNWKVWPTLNREEHEKRNGGLPSKDQSEGSTNFVVSNPETTVSETAHDFSYVTWFEEPSEKRDAARILADFLGRRRVKTAEAHLLCFLMFVDPEYQRKGAGSMCMRWGTELADLLMLPCWIEASQKGEGLYRKFGYEGAGEDEYGRGRARIYLKTENFLSEYMHMRRPTKVERLVGMELKRG